MRLGLMNPEQSSIFYDLSEHSEPFLHSDYHFGNKYDRFSQLANDNAFDGDDPREYQKKSATKSGKSLSKKESARNSTARYRERKKQALKQLESTVRALEIQVASTEKQLKQMKEKVNNALESKAKNNQISFQENTEVFQEIKQLIHYPGFPSHSNSSHICIDTDKLNLLLDTLKYRIGASGRERQAKLNFQFRNIVNTLFPALYRYVLLTAVDQTDLFARETDQNLPWTRQLFQKLSLSDRQFEQLQRLKPRIIDFFRRISKDIHQLTALKGELRKEGIQIEKIEEMIREEIDPVQCAQWTLFCEKFKYRKQLMLDDSIADRRPTLEEVEGSSPKKKVKKSQV